jgi:DNA-binding protein YbaB
VGVSQSTEERLAHYAEMKEEISAVRATVSSSDRAITVVAGAGGSVMDIQVADQALRGANAQTLGRTIMSTIQLALAKAAKAQAEVVQRYVGDRMNILDRVNAVQQEFFDKAKEEAAREGQQLGQRSAPPAPPAHAAPPAPQRQEFQPPARPGRPAPRRRPQDDFVDDNDGFQGLGKRDQW